MRHNSGISLIEAMFGILLLSIITIGGASFFIKDQHFKQDIKFTSESQLIHRQIINFIKKDLEHSLSSVSYNDKKLIVSTPLNDCSGEENHYKATNEGLYCNDLKINSSVIQLNFKFGFDTQNDNIVDTYSNKINVNGDLKTIFIETITRSPQKRHQNKEYTIDALDGIETIYSDYFIKNHRSVYWEKI